MCSCLCFVHIVGPGILGQKHVYCMCCGSFMFLSYSCVWIVWLCLGQVLESFKIMDYSLLLGVHVLDKSLERGSRGDSKRLNGQRVLYSTALESIQGDGKVAEPVADDT